MKRSIDIATSSFILTNYMHLLDGNDESAEKIGSDELKIPSFSEDILINLCNSAINILKQKNQTLINLSLPSIVIGDLHGNLHDLIRFINSIKDVFSNNILFLGDYVDRGQYQLETITLLLALRIEYPDNFFLIRGNHEFTAVNSQGGFKDEVIQAGYSESLFDKFNEVFSYLPIAALINNNIFCVHGGLSPLFKNIKQIETDFKLPIRNIYKSTKKKAKHRLSDSRGFDTPTRRSSPLGIQSRMHRFSGDSSDLQIAAANVVMMRQSSKKMSAETKSKSQIYSKLPSLNSHSSLLNYIPNGQITKPKASLSTPSSPFGSNSQFSSNSAHNLNIQSSSNLQMNALTNNVPVPPLKPSPNSPNLPTHNKLMPKIPIPPFHSQLNRANSPFISPSRPKCISSRVEDLNPAKAVFNDDEEGEEEDEIEDDSNNIAMLTDLMWSDPSNLTEFFLPSNRGSGWYFGIIATNTFMQENQMKMIVRGHESIKKGVQTMHENRVVTVYSSSSASQDGLAGCVIFSTNDNVDVYKLQPIKIIQRSEAKFFTPTLKHHKTIRSLTENPSTMKLSKSKMCSARQSSKCMMKESFPQTLDSSMTGEKQ